MPFASIPVVLPLKRGYYTRADSTIERFVCVSAVPWKSVRAEVRVWRLGAHGMCIRAHAELMHVHVSGWKSGEWVEASGSECVGVCASRPSSWVERMGCRDCYF